MCEAYCSVGRKELDVSAAGVLEGGVLIGVPSLLRGRRSKQVWAGVKNWCGDGCTALAAGSEKSPFATVGL